MPADRIHNTPQITRVFLLNLNTHTRFGSQVQKLHQHIQVLQRYDWSEVSIGQTQTVLMRMYVDIDTPSTYEHDFVFWSKNVAELRMGFLFQECFGGFCEYSGYIFQAGRIERVFALGDTGLKLVCNELGIQESTPLQRYFQEDKESPL